MSATYRLLPEAEEDALDARAWYEKQQVGRGDEFIEELHRRLKSICQFPATHGKVTKHVRAARMKKSKFNIYYRIQESVVVVSAILHERADVRKRLRRK